jgi:hypothetical protein
MIDVEEAVSATRRQTYLKFAWPGGGNVLIEPSYARNLALNRSSSLGALALGGLGWVWLVKWPLVPILAFWLWNPWILLVWLVPVKGLLNAVSAAKAGKVLLRDEKERARAIRGKAVVRADGKVIDLKT